MIRNAKLNAENSKIYFFAPSRSCEVYSRKVIRLASEEMSVPTPPTLTPRSRGCHSVVNCESKIADGTLLITWQERVETTSAFFSIKYPNAFWITEILDIFPEKMKNATKVKSKP